jgi:hypothetical protein
MSSVPLDLERRFERRWAARFVRQAPKPASEKREYGRLGQRFGEAAKAKRKTCRHAIGENKEAAK